jgi:hypothetical protein
VIKILDVVGKPMDCCAAVSLALGRMGVHVAPDAFTSAPHLWREVDLCAPDSIKAGDVIVSRPNGRLHVAVVLEGRAGHGVAFTSDARMGATTVPLSRALADRVGVWRYVAPVQCEAHTT